MPEPESTCWTLIRGAALGVCADRDAFVARYMPVARAYLAARWRGGPLMGAIADATEEVFLECFRAGGALERAAPEREEGFRAYLIGLVRNVARMTEERRRRSREIPMPSETGAATLDDQDETPSRAFDHAWARQVLKEAAEHHRETALERGTQALQRVELLRLRFQEGRPIRDVAREWGIPAVQLHHEYALARKEFRLALREVLCAYNPVSPAELERDWAAILSSLPR